MFLAVKASICISVCAADKKMVTRKVQQFSSDVIRPYDPIFLTRLLYRV